MLVVEVKLKSGSSITSSCQNNTEVAKFLKHIEASGLDVVDFSITTNKREDVYDA